jgi:hypothetical protein
MLLFNTVLLITTVNTIHSILEELNNMNEYLLFQKLKNHLINRNNTTTALSHLAIIIARYKEETSHLHWLTNYNHVIYNRGERINNSSLNIIQQYENVGRESFIYLQHIIKHYHRLPQLLVFSQAAQRSIEVFNYTNINFQETVQKIANKEIILNSNNDGFAYIIPRCFDFSFGVKSWKFEKDNYFINLYGFEAFNPRFSPTGCFLVTRDAILRNSKEYYIKLIKTLNYENSPRIGHFFERSWSYVFHSNCSNDLQKFYCHLGNIVNDTCLEHN